MVLEVATPSIPGLAFTNPCAIWLFAFVTGAIEHQKNSWTSSSRTRAHGTGRQREGVRGYGGEEDFAEVKENKVSTSKFGFGMVYDVFKASLHHSGAWLLSHLYGDQLHVLSFVMRVSLSRETRFQRQKLSTSSPSIAIIVQGAKDDDSSSFEAETSQ